MSEVDRAKWLGDRPKWESGLVIGDYWQTPEEILAPCESVAVAPLFDLCPANPGVDALAEDFRWGRSCFVNPPYSRGQLEKWAEKAVNEIDAEKTEEVFWLINYGATENRRTVKSRALAIVDLYRRVSFVDPISGERKKGNDRDSVIYYWSSYVMSAEMKKKFREAFQSLGEVFFADD